MGAPLDQQFVEDMEGVLRRRHDDPDRQKRPIMRFYSETDVGEEYSLWWGGCLHDGVGTYNGVHGVVSSVPVHIKQCP